MSYLSYTICKTITKWIDYLPGSQYLVMYIIYGLGVGLRLIRPGFNIEIIINASDNEKNCLLFKIVC